MTEINPWNQTPEDVKRLLELEKKRLLKSLNNIREFDPEIYDDGLRWLLLEITRGDPLVKPSVSFQDLEQIADRLSLKYPHPKTSDLFHDTVLPQIKRLVEIDGEKVFINHFGPNYKVTTFKTFGKMTVIK